MLGVAHKDHGSLGPQCFDATRKRFVGHVVLEDVDQRFVRTLGLACELVEGHGVPVAHKTDAPAGIVDEKLGDRHLAARDEDAVGRKLGIDMRLAGALGAKFNQVVVALAKGDQPCELQKFGAPPKEVGIEADALHEQVDPASLSK